MNNIEKLSVDCISNDGAGASIFTKQVITLEGKSERRLSEQMPALNFRLRTSDHTYSSNWHVAGDPTLLVILSGTLRLTLRNGEWLEIQSGGMFIAQDYLSEPTQFDSNLHGHRAQVVGEEPIKVMHLKLRTHST